MFSKALNISNLLYIREDFNIKDAEWNLVISSYSVASQALRNLADSYSLMCSILSLPVPTHYLDIKDYANTVVNLILLGMSYAQVFYCIKPDLKQSLDYAFLIVDFPITLENICIYRIVLECNGNEEVAFCQMQFTLGLKVCKEDSEMCRLVEQPWL